MARARGANPQVLARPDGGLPRRTALLPGIARAGHVGNAPLPFAPDGGSHAPRPLPSTASGVRLLLRRGP
eukprot:11928131-Alexandrium_andersonii.AAC.1